jgi:hypothetical protein
VAGLAPLRFLLAAPLVLSLACEEKAEDLGAGDLRRQELLARCDFLVRCGFAPDHETCRASEGPDWGLVQALGVSNLGRVEYDANAGQIYVETLSERSCEATEENAREISNLREDMFVGQVDIGDGCFASEECVGDAVCDLWACPDDQVCCTGRCVERRILGVGSECPLAESAELYYTECEFGSFCRPPPDDGSGVPPVAGVCAPRVENGAPCVTNGECSDAQRCDLGGSNTCYMLSVAGDPCNPLLSQGACIDFDHVCDPASSTCVRAPGPGAPCPSGQCLGFSECIEGTCIAQPRWGEPCDGTVSCLGDLFCNAEGWCDSITVVFACLSGDDPPPPEPMG